MLKAIWEELPQVRTVLREVEGPDLDHQESVWPKNPVNLGKYSGGVLDVLERRPARHDVKRVVARRNMARLARREGEVWRECLRDTFANGKLPKPFHICNDVEAGQVRGLS